jgi:hypothetical protein
MPFLIKKRSGKKSTSLKQPLTLGKPGAAVEAASPSKAPGLDGLSYEFYKATFAWVGQPILEACNEMLASCLLAPSMRLGVVRLLPKVPGVPMASQLRPLLYLGRTISCSQRCLWLASSLFYTLSSMPTSFAQSIGGQFMMDQPPKQSKVSQHLGQGADIYPAHPKDCEGAV